MRLASSTVLRGHRFNFLEAELVRWDRDSAFKPMHGGSWLGLANLGGIALDGPSLNPRFPGLRRLSPVNG